MLFLIACASDIAIITTQEKENVDTSVYVEETILEDTAEEYGNSYYDLNVGLAKIHFRQIACPQCVGEYSEFDIKAELNLYMPTSASNFDYMTEMGSCITQLMEVNVSSQPLSANNNAYFGSIQLSPSGIGLWSRNNLYEHEIQRQTYYNINTEYGNVENAFKTIEGFDDIQPYTLLWVDPSYAFDAVISKSGNNFSWYPVLSEDIFEIIIAVYSPDGSNFLGAVSCLDQDRGNMFISGEYFLNFPTWSLTAVHLIRHRIDSVQSEELGGVLETHMIWEVVGTGHIE